MDPLPPIPRAGILVRIPAVFEDLAADILADLSARPAKPLGREFHLIRPADPATARLSPAFRFVAWNLPVHHAWPCCPPKTASFVEKAAQTLARKFGPLHPQAAWVGPLLSGPRDSYYRRLASNLRGRLLQLLPELAPSADPEQQDPAAPSLYCLVGTEGLFSGLQSPRDCNGFFPGGTRFFRQNGHATVSRAGAKLAGALHFLHLHRPPPPAGSRWLELGASPGGMTSELLDRGHHVTAVDLAPLDPRLDGRAGLDFRRADAARWQPSPGSSFDAILCDLNGEACRSIRQVARLAPHLRPGGLVIFTLKLGAASTLAAIEALHRETQAIATTAGLLHIATTHLTHNRREFTLLFHAPGSHAPLQTHSRASI